MYQDVWAALHLPVDAAGELGALHGNVTRGAQDLFIPRDGGLCLGRAECIAAQSEVMKFVGPHTKGVPIWLAVTYLSSNVVLNSLNFYWFGKMIKTVRQRFEKNPDLPSDGDGKDEKKSEGEKNSVRRRRRSSSIVLEVADGLEKDERLRIMMDGAADGGGAGQTPQEVEGMSEEAQQMRDSIEDKAKTTAFQQQNNNNNSSAAAANGNNAGTRRR